MQTTIFVIITILANAFANIFLKMGADRLPPLAGGNLVQNAIKFISSPYILIGALLFATNFPMYNIVLQRLKLSIAFPLVTTTAFALTVVISVFFFKEALSAAQYGGLLLLAVAIWLIAAR